MRAVVMDRIGAPLEVREVPDPVPPADGVVVEVRATGLCRSDWHAWAGHDEITLPYVPGHELAGTIAAVGAGVTKWSAGDRVTVPFAEDCGELRPQDLVERVIGLGGRRRFSRPSTRHLRPAWRSSTRAGVGRFG